MEASFAAEASNGNDAPTSADTAANMDDVFELLDDLRAEELAQPVVASATMDASELSEAAKSTRASGLINKLIEASRSPAANASESIDGSEPMDDSESVAS